MYISEQDYNIVITGLRKQLELHNKKQQELISQLDSLKEARNKDEELLCYKSQLISKLDASITRCLKCGERVTLSVSKSFWVHLTKDLKVLQTECKAHVYKSK